MSKLYSAKFELQLEHSNFKTVSNPLLFQIAADIIGPSLMVIYGIRSTFFPMKEVFGENFCYFFSFLEPWTVFVGQFHSYFTTAFRYICLFHHENMLTYHITPKVIKFYINTYLKLLNKLLLYSNTFRKQINL